MEVKFHVPREGVGISTVVLVVFVILKLVGVIDWSWVWVLSPLWIGLAVPLLVYLVAVLVAVLCTAVYVIGTAVDSILRRFFEGGE